MLSPKRQVNRRSQNTPFHPNQVVLLADGAAGQKFLASHAEFYQSLAPINGMATAFVCENFVCNLPTNEPEKLRQLLEK